ncbi:MAG: hypothetical protein MUF15_18700, partial [Acidobacteria bacterium]|nr:hypothetical protein [Acidobacteriota bacterium]
MKNNIYNFIYENKKYFYDPGSGGVYFDNSLLQDILALAPSLDDAQITRELSHDYPIEKIALDNKTIRKKVVSSQTSVV